MKVRKIGFVITSLAIISGLTWLAGLQAFPVQAQGSDLILPITHEHFNAFEVRSPLDTGNGTMGENNYKNPSNPICTIPAASGTNASTDCEGTNPHNETSIAANPSNPQNIIGGANDYQIRLSSGGTVNETVYTRAHVSFDGGKTWAMVPLPVNAYTGTGDPAVAFDSNGTAYMATLGFSFPQGQGLGTTADIVATTSSDGGKTWRPLVRVAGGTGSYISPGVFNDKEYIAAWGNGNAIITWTVFNSGAHGVYINSPIYASVTHDSGKTWSQGLQISGQAPFCVGAYGDTACDQDQGSVPTVTADGSIYVSFFSTANMTNFRDQVLVVKVDPATGQRIGGPYKVSDVTDGTTDYPINADGRQTYQDSQFRTWSFGNLTSDPKHPTHLAMVWSDMRNSTLPAPSDPYSVKTNSDVIVSQSLDGGFTWSSPVALTRPGDQFMPWGSYDKNGQLRIGFFDRSYDPANHHYGYTLATEKTANALKFSFSQVTTALSDPTRDNRWFAVNLNSSYPNASAFVGDYSNINIAPTGITALWTDLRAQACFANHCAAGQNSYFAAAK